MEPSHSLPTEIGANPAATPMALPDDEPHGVLRNVISLTTLYDSAEKKDLHYAPGMLHRVSHHLSRMEIGPESYDQPGSDRER